MSGFIVAGLCLAGCAVIFGGFELFVGSGRAKLHDLTRSGFAVDGEWHPAVDPETRARRNDLSVRHYLRVSEQRGYRVRPARVVPDPVQLHGWEDDGGAPA